MKAGLRRSGGEQKRRQDETKSVRANAINAVENATQARSRDLAVEVRRESVVDIVRARHVTVVGARDPVLGLAAEARGGQTGEVETIATDVIDAIYETAVAMTTSTIVRGTVMELLATMRTHKMRQKDSD
jgi:hypothetical protein